MQLLELFGDRILAVIVFAVMQVFIFQITTPPPSNPQYRTLLTIRTPQTYFEKICTSKYWGYFTYEKDIGKMTEEYYFVCQIEALASMLLSTVMIICADDLFLTMFLIYLFLLGIEGGVISSVLPPIVYHLQKRKMR